MISTRASGSSVFRVLAMSVPELPLTSSCRGAYGKRCSGNVLVVSCGGRPPPPPPPPPPAGAGAGAGAGPKQGSVAPKSHVNVHVGLVYGLTYTEKAGRDLNKYTI